MKTLLIEIGCEEIPGGYIVPALTAFKQNILARETLLGTSTKELVEGNYWHDNVWGDCSCEKCKNIKGQNLLGKQLMQVRQEIRTVNERADLWPEPIVAISELVDTFVEQEKIAVMNGEIPQIVVDELSRLQSVIHKLATP